MEPVEVTLEDKEAVVAARTAVDAALALGAEETDFVNLWKLEGAEATIAELEAGAADAEAVQTVIDMIAELEEAAKTQVTVTEVVDITRTGVEVTFDALGADNPEATVVVKDGESNVVPTEPTLVAEGSTSLETKLISKQHLMQQE